MSTIIIITRPRVVARSHEECNDLETHLQAIVDELREAGYDVEIQRPE